MYKDTNGRIWWDEDEAIELAGLHHTGPTPLGAYNAHKIGAKEKDTKRRGLFPRIIASSKAASATPLPAAPDWVSLDSPPALSPSSPDAVDAERRGNANSEASRDSELDARAKALLSPALALVPHCSQDTASM